MLHKYQQKILNIVYIMWGKKDEDKKNLTRSPNLPPCFNLQVKRSGLYWLKISTQPAKNCGLCGSIWQVRPILSSLTKI